VVGAEPDPDWGGRAEPDPDWFGSGNPLTCASPPPSELGKGGRAEPDPDCVEAG